MSDSTPKGRGANIFATSRSLVDFIETRFGARHREPDATDPFGIVIERLVAAYSEFGIQDAVASESLELAKMVSARATNYPVIALLPVYRLIENCVSATGFMFMRSGVSVMRPRSTSLRLTIGGDRREIEFAVFQPDRPRYIGAAGVFCGYMDSLSAMLDERLHREWVSYKNRYLL